MGKINSNGHTEDTVYGKGGEETRPARDASETVYAGGDETVRNRETEKTVRTAASDETAYAGDPGETVFAGEQTREAIAEAEKSVALDWNAGDVILGLYEVLPVDDAGKAYHAGGFGKVYRVRHKTWKADLAVKAPQAHAFADEAQKENFIRECRAWIELGTHPNIATCYYVRELGGVPRIFAEYVAGGSLKNWIRGGRLYEGGGEESLRRILDISIQFARGLGYAHEQGMTHRDVKPQNVMMTPGGEAKVVDFGLARETKAKKPASPFIDPPMLNRGHAKTAPGARKAGGQDKEPGGYTPAYCSPEQAEGRPLSQGTDIWSFGVSVLEMFTGEATWQSGTVAPYVLEAYLDGMAEEENEALPPMPEGIAKLLKRCFAEDETGRPHSMKDVADSLIAVYQAACGTDYPRRPAQGAPDSADTLNNRALSYLDLGNGSKAKMLWDQAVGTDPRHAASVYNRGLMQWRKGALSDQRLLDALLSARENTDEWQSLYLLGQVHMERGDAESAAAVLAEAAARSGGDEQVTAALQTAKNGQEKWSRCVNTFQNVKGLPVLGADGQIAEKRSGDSADFYDAVTGERLHTIKGYKPYGAFLDISGDGCRVIAMISATDFGVWDFQTGKCLRTFSGGRAHVNFVSLSADGRRALSGTSHIGRDFNEVNLWDIRTGECLQTFKGHRKGIKWAVLSRDMKRVVSAGMDELVKIWDVSTGECIRDIQRPKVSRVAVSADGRFVLSDGRDNSGAYTLKLWEDMGSRCRYVRTFYGHKEPVTSLTLSDDGRLCLSSGEDATVRLWDIATGRCLRTFEGHTEKVDAATLSAGARYIFSGSRNNSIFKLWAVGASGYAAPWQLSRPESSAEAFQRKEQIDLYMRKAKEAFGQADMLQAAEILEKAKQLPDCAKNRDFYDAWAGLYDYLPKRRFDSAWTANRFIVHGEIHCGSLSPDGVHAVLGYYSHSELWDVLKRTSLMLFKGHREKVSSVAFSADGATFLSGSFDGEVRLWDTASGRCLRTLKDMKPICGVSLSTDDRIAASAGRQLTLWDLQTQACLQTFKGHMGNVLAVALSPDGRRLLSGGEDRTARLWDAATGECLLKYKGHTQKVLAVSLSPCGRFALSGGMDKTVRIWDAVTGECLHILAGHAGSVNTVAFSPDGRFAVSGSDDETLRLWDAATGKCLHVLKGSQDPVRLACFSQNGRYLLSGGKKEVRLWELLWEVEKQKPAGWDDGALPYLKNFLERHRPPGAENPLLRKGEPEWTDNDFERLMKELGCRGYGWLKPAGVRDKLKELIR